MAWCARVLGSARIPGARRAVLSAFEARQSVRLAAPVSGAHSDWRSPYHNRHPLHSLQSPWYTPWRPSLPNLVESSEDVLARGKRQLRVQDCGLGPHECWIHIPDSAATWPGGNKCHNVIALLSPTSARPCVNRDRTTPTFSEEDAKKTNMNSGFRCALRGGPQCGTSPGRASRCKRGLRSTRR